MLFNKLFLAGGVLLAGGGVSGATAIALVKRNNQSNNKEEVTSSDDFNNGLEFKKIEASSESKSQSFETKIELPSELLVSSKQEESFEGKLVFSRDINSPRKGVVGPSIYKGEIFTNDEFKNEEKKWKESDEDDNSEKEEDSEAHITIDLPSEKIKKSSVQLKEYLEELNKNTEKQKNGNNLLDKLQNSLENDKEKFKENFGSETYDNLLEKIKKLKIPKEK